MVTKINNIDIAIWELVTDEYDQDKVLEVDGDLYIVDHSVSKLEEGDTFIASRVKSNMQLTDQKYIINRTAHSNGDLTYRVAYVI